MLPFVTLTNGASSADVIIDASSLSDNATPYPMVLESRDTNSALPALVLKTDTVNIYVTMYARAMQVETLKIILKGNSATFSVEKALSSITLPNTPSVLLRQKVGAELSFVAIQDGASTTSASVTIDTTS